MNATRKHTATQVAARVITGRDLDGGHRTDARWNAHGSRSLTITGHASRWAHYPHQRRAGIRALALVTVLLLITGLLTNVAATGATLRVLTWIVLGIATWMVVEKSRRYVHRREVVAPLADALAAHLHDSRYMLDPRTWMDIPVDVQERPSRVYLKQALVLTDAAEKSLARLVARKVGLVNPTSTFVLRGERPFMELRPAPAPPERVSFTDPNIRALVEAAPKGHTFLGLAPRDEPLYLDRIKGAPHVGWSMPTNAGKSTAARGGIMQFLHEGGVTLILDPKMDSHPWARDLPNVRYADSPQEIHEALMWLSGEVDRRNAIGKAHGDYYGNVDPALIGPEILVIAEELNSMENDLSTYWRTIRDPKRGDPLKPVSLTSLGRALNMGRSKRVYIWPIAQELLVQSLGGPAAKANLSTRILGRAAVATWNKLAPECKRNGRYPRKLMELGRVYVVTGDEPVPVQVMHVDEEVAREYALSGTVATFPTVATVPGGVGDASRSSQAGGLSGSPHPPLTVVRDEVGLAEAATRLGVPQAKLLKARERSGSFPVAVGEGVRGMKLYRFDQLSQWLLRTPSQESDEDVS